jgi:4-amino-4-deoxy-L-arabinose transferase-like glycosyltransferase
MVSSKVNCSCSISLQTLAVLTVITLFGVFLRGWVAIGRPLNIDEASSINTACTTSYPHLLLWRHDDYNQPPLSFLLIKISFLLSNTSNLSVARFLPFIVGVLCIPATWYLGRLVYSSKLGLWAALLAACDPVMGLHFC